MWNARIIVLLTLCACVQRADTFAPLGVAAMSLSPSTIAADGVDVAYLAVHIRDNTGKALAGITVVFSSTGVPVNVVALGASDANGLCIASVTGSLAGVATIKAAALLQGGHRVTVPATATIVLSSSVASGVSSSLTASPSSATADGRSAIALTVSVKDVLGAGVPGVSVALSSSGTANTLGAVNGATDARGVFATTLVSTVAEAKTVTASFNNSTVQTTVLFIAGAPASITLTANAPGSALADGVQPVVLVATVVDAHANPVSGATVAFSGPPGVALAPAQSATSASGIATSAASSSQVATVPMLAKVAGITSAPVNIAFVYGPMSSTTSTFTVLPTSQTADGGATMAMTLTAKDAQNHLLANQAVTFNASSTANTFNAASSSTDASGVWRATLASTLAQVQTLTAGVGGPTLSAVVTFTAGAQVASTSAFTVDTNSVVADGLHPINVTLVLRDAHNNPVPNAAATFTSSRAGDTFLPQAYGTTDSAGKFTAAVISTVSGARNFSVQTTPAFTALAVTYVPGPPTVANSNFTVNPNMLDTLSTVSGQVTLTLRDAYNNLVTNYPVTLGSTGSNVVYSPASGGNTNGSAVFIASVSSTTVQSVNLTAGFGTSSMATPISFFQGSASASKSTFVVNPNNGILANRSANANAVITLRDSLGYPLPNYRLSINAVATQAPGFYATAVTDSNGYAVVPVTSTFTGPKSIAVHAGGMTLLGNANFVAPGAACATSVHLGKPPVHLEFYNIVNVGLGDWDNDGKNDVLVSNFGSNVLIPSYGLGNGTFTQVGGLFTDFTVNALATCDLNKDAVDDALALSQGNGNLKSYMGASTRASALQQAGQTTIINANLGFSVVSCADFDGNGNQDVLVSTQGQNRIAIVTGNGDGTLNSSVLMTPSSPLVMAVAADFNKDGRGDVAYCDAANINVMLGNGDLTFRAPWSYTYGTSCEVQVGYVNTDAYPDLLVTAGPGLVGIFLGVGDGTFTLKSQVAVTGISAIVRVADFNKDGFNDFVVATSSLNASVVALGNGDGTFQTPQSYVTYAAPTTSAPGDLNGDGYPDFVTSDSASTWLTSVLNKGDGTFYSQTNYATGAGPTALSSGDLNTDGNVDLVVADGVGKSVNVFTGTGTGTFTANGSYALGQTPVSVTVADLNHDGLLDVAASLSLTGGIAVFAGTGGGVLSTTPTVYASNTNNRGLVAGDFNADGLTDLATTNGDANTVSVLLQKASGGFAAPVTYPTQGVPDELSTMEVDLDGAADLVVALLGTPNIGLMRGNGDGTFKAIALTTGNNVSGGSYATTFADFNADGVPELVSADNTSGGGQFQTYTYNAGAFAANSTVVQSRQPIDTHVLTCDLDNDGAPDLVGTDYTDSSLVVNLGRGGEAFTQEDLYDGGGQPIDLVVGDFDHDGRSDVAAINSVDNTLTIRLNHGCL